MGKHEHKRPIAHVPAPDESIEPAPPETPAVETETPEQIAGHVQAKLQSIMDSFDPGLPNGNFLTEGIETPGVIPNEPLMPTLASMEAGIYLDSAAGNAKLEADPGVAAKIAGLKAAMSNEAMATVPTAVAIGREVAQMPRNAKDLANQLYYDKKQNYTRRKADRVLLALFDESLMRRILVAAGKRGFEKKPLVWISQLLWQHIQYDVQHNFEVEGAMPFQAQVDDNVTSTLHKCLSLFLDALTVKGLSRLARYKNVSVFTVLHVIFSDECNAMKVAPASELPPVNLDQLV